MAEAIEPAAALGQDMQVVVPTSRWCSATPGTMGWAAALASWAMALTDLMTGDPGAALDRLERVWARDTASPVGRALALRCEALLGEGTEAPRAFEAALRVDGCGPYDRARTRLAYGEWLRRNRRRTAARAQLVEALDTFERIAAHGWRRRVRAELTALGDPVLDPHPAVGGAGLLTPQELQVVRRSARGMTNREIAAELFLSPHTVVITCTRPTPSSGSADVPSSPSSTRDPSTSHLTDSAGPAGP